MKKIIRFFSILIASVIAFDYTLSQDLIEHALNPTCATNSNIQFCSQNYASFFPMEDDTLRALVVFANYPDGNWDPIDMNSNLIYMKYWSGDSAFQKPLWADSVICQSTTNVWDPSLTGLISKSSNGKFWLIGDFTGIW